MTDGQACLCSVRTHTHLKYWNPPLLIVPSTTLCLFLMPDMTLFPVLAVLAILAILPIPPIPLALPILNLAYSPYSVGANAERQWAMSISLSPAAVRSIDSRDELALALVSAPFAALVPLPRLGLVPLLGGSLRALGGSPTAHPVVDWCNESERSRRFPRAVLLGCDCGGGGGSTMRVGVDGQKGKIGQG